MEKFKNHSAEKIRLIQWPYILNKTDGWPLTWVRSFLMDVWHSRDKEGTAESERHRLLLHHPAWPKEAFGREGVDFPELEDSCE